MIDTVVNGILALADPHYLARVSVEQLGHDLIDEVRLFGLFSDREMGDVERYVERLMEEQRTNRLSSLPVHNGRANPPLLEKV
jgi:hypothetical protein